MHKINDCLQGIFTTLIAWFCHFATLIFYTMINCTGENACKIFYLANRNNHKIKVLTS